MKAPFDIAGDLDTPVSAYMKLAAFKPCFLLESVEGGERLARYSFVGFGDSLEIKLDAAGLKVGDVSHARPGNAKELLKPVARRSCRCPTPRAGDIRGAPGRWSGGVCLLRCGALLRAPAQKGRDPPMACRRCTTWHPARFWFSIT